MANEGHGPEEIPITIDNKPFKVKNPVKGSRLYELGSVGDAYELWVKGRGGSDDTAVNNDQTDYKVEPGDKLFTVEKTLNPGGVYVGRPV